MNITDVRIRRINSDGKMKAVASITFDDEFVVHDIKIIDGQNGPFIAMPSRKVAEGDFHIGNGYYMNDYIMGLKI